MSKEDLIKILASLTQEQLAIIEEMLNKLNAHSQKIRWRIILSPCTADIYNAA